MPASLPTLQCKAMKLYTAPRAPNPRRVDMFLAEKSAPPIERIAIDINSGAHRTSEFLAKNPIARIPVLELDDGRLLAESRAICTYLEGLYPEPNLMGSSTDERAFIEMADRQVEFTLLATIANAIRHTHPGLAALEQPQFAEFGKSQFGKLAEKIRWLDDRLATQAFVASDRFTIADITAFCGIEFARLLKWKPADIGLTHLQAWRERIATRPSAQV
jgi:glutathione S-transferase